MKQVKVAFNKCKMKMPNRPPDEIDFGLGFRAALLWFYKVADHLSPTDCDILDEELDNENKKM